MHSIAFWLHDYSGCEAPSDHQKVGEVSGSLDLEKFAEFQF